MCLPVEPKAMSFTGSILLQALALTALPVRLLDEDHSPIGDIDPMQAMILARSGEYEGAGNAHRVRKIWPRKVAVEVRSYVPSFEGLGQTFLQYPQKSQSTHSRRIPRELIA